MGKTRNLYTSICTGVRVAAAMVSRQAGGVIADLTAPLTMFGLFSGVFIAATLVLLRVDPSVPSGVVSESPAD